MFTKWPRRPVSVSKIDLLDPAKGHGPLSPFKNTEHGPLSPFFYMCLPKASEIKGAVFEMNEIQIGRFIVCCFWFFCLSIMFFVLLTPKWESKPATGASHNGSPKDKTTEGEPLFKSSPRRQLLPLQGSHPEGQQPFLRGTTCTRLVRVVAAPSCSYNLDPQLCLSGDAQTKQSCRLRTSKCATGTNLVPWIRRQCPSQWPLWHRIETNRCSSTCTKDKCRSSNCNWLTSRCSTTETYPIFEEVERVRPLSGDRWVEALDVRGKELIAMRLATVENMAGLFA